MKTEELENRLRDVLRERASRITEAELGADAPESGAMVSTSRAGGRRWQGLAVAAVVLVVVGLVAAGMFGRAEPPTGERVEQIASEPQGEVTGEIRLRAWPLNSDEPLSGGSQQDGTTTTQVGADPEELRTPESTARSYLTHVVRLPADWPIEDVSTDGDTAVARYILQDVPGEIRMARSA